MSDLIRPEVRAGFMRWREAIAGAGLVALGLWWSLGAGGLMTYVGFVTTCIGLLIGWMGLQRGRFRSSGEAAGIVLVDEGQISYFGPLGGGIIAVSDLTRLTLLHRGDDRLWHVTTEDGGAVEIPLDATGAEALLDAFAALPGLKTERMLAEMRRPASGPVTIWTRGGSPNLTLH